MFWTFPVWVEVITVYFFVVPKSSEIKDSILPVDTDWTASVICLTSGNFLMAAEIAEIGIVWTWVMGTSSVCKVVRSTSIILVSIIDET